MSDAKNNGAPDVLEEALRQLRESPVDEARLPAALDKTRGALTEAARRAGAGAGPQSSDSTSWRKEMNPIWTRLGVAAAVLLIATGLGRWLLRDDMGAGVAFADVVQALQESRTVTYTARSRTMASDTGTADSPPTLVKVAIAEPDRVRMEVISEADGAVELIQIWNLREGRSLTLRPPTQIAIGIDLPSAPRLSAVPLRPELDAWVTLRELRQPDVQSAESLGERQIGETTAVGFRIRNTASAEVIDVWADAQTSRPVVVERTGKGRPITGFTTHAEWGADGEPRQHAAPFTRSGDETTVRQTITDIRFDVPLDEALFSVVPPEGYQLHKPQKTSFSFMGGPDDASEENLIDGLRVLAESSGNAFPNEIGDFQTGFMDIARRAREGNPTTTQIGSRLQAYAAVRGFMHRFAARYTGRGVRLGDAGEPVLSWQPADENGHRVVFGDLTIRNVGPEEWTELKTRIDARTEGHSDDTADE